MEEITFYAYCDINEESYWKEQLIKDHGKLEFITVYYLFGDEKYKRVIEHTDVDSFIALQIPEMLIKDVIETEDKVNFKQKDGKDELLTVSKVTIKKPAQFFIAYLEEIEPGTTKCTTTKPAFLDTHLNEDSLKSILSGLTSGFTVNATVSRPICR